MSPRSRFGLIVTLASIIGLFNLTLCVSAVDAKLNEGKVARRIAIAGRAVGGSSGDELHQHVAELAEAYNGAHVRITSPAGDLDQTAANLGLNLDQPAVEAAAMAYDRDIPFFLQPLRRLQSVLTERAVAPQFTLDDARFAAGIAELVKANERAAAEPSIRESDDGIVAVPGTPGQTIHAEQIARMVKAGAEAGDTPIVVDTNPDPLPPRFTTEDAAALADKANAVTKTPLALTIGARSGTIPVKTLRSLFTATPGPTALDLHVDIDRIAAALPALVGDVGTKPTEPTFSVAGDKVAITDGKPGTQCCAPDSSDRIAKALVAGQSSVTLDLVPMSPEHDRAWAEGLKITAPVGSFTTNHACCEDRVTNIHHIADAVRGMYIKPGETFSVNDRVGQRTREKGYIEAPVIYNATHDVDVGGGVSQFATTLFNAAFFGGFDIPEYQSHSEYISRYPLGREATISWPKPDLKIKNNSPYGVLVWPTYTDTSLTVTLYSSRWATGEQTGQSSEPRDPCTRYTTERTRTFASDGHTEVDRVYALYQPADNVKCP
jgi:vancomycin resistance protein YoaR